MHTHAKAIVVGMCRVELRFSAAHRKYVNEFYALQVAATIEAK